jgi:hypothetical protein
MAKGFSLSKILLNPTKKNDVFLLVLLAASLSLNVYLGWSVKRLSSAPSAKPADAVKLSPGTPVEPIAAVSLSGGRQETISYSDGDKPTVFYVFSPTCVWCERNSRNINAIADLKGGDFRFIGLSLADDGLQEYVESHHLNFPVYKSLTPETVQTLGLGSTPQTIVISPDGHVRQNWVGAYGAAIQPQVEGFFNVRLPGLAAPAPRK